MTVEGKMSIGKLIAAGCLFAILSFALFTTSAVSAVKIDFLGGKPTELLTDIDGDELIAIVARKGAKFLSSPNVDGEDLSKGPEFREAVNVYKATTDSSYYLVETENAGWGWISADDLLLRLRSLRVSDLEYEQCHGQNPVVQQNRRVGTNPALVKVVIRNNWRLEKGRGKSISLFSRPGSSTEDEVAKSNLFKIYYAYKSCKGSDGKSYLLVGTEPTLDPDYAHDIITGWVPKAETIVWGSMTAAYYNKTNMDKREPVHIFKTEKDLRNYMRSGETDKAIGKEDISRREPLPYYASRYPIIRARRRAYKIAWIGDGYDESSGKIVQREVVESKREDAMKLASALGKRDVLFLIDSTTSMGKYFDIVANALEEFIEGLNARESNRFKYALAIYRDYGNVTGAFEILSDFDDSNVALKLDPDMAANYTGNIDLSEAVFNGIVNSVNGVSWRHNATRSIIVIGDHGNHESDPRGLTTRDVVAALKKNSVLFYALNVTPIIGRFSEYNRLFKKQSRLILDRHHSMGGEIFSTPQDEQEDENGARENISKVLREITKISKFAEKATREVLTEGKSFEEAEAEYGTIVTAYMREVMSNAGLKQTEIANIRQLAEEGWVAAQSLKGQQANLTPEFLMGRSKLDEFIGFLSRMNSDISKRRNGRGLASAVKKHAEVTTGDEIGDDETVSEFLQRQFHIPFRETSTVLNYNPKVLEEKFKSSKSFRTKLKRRICIQYIKFQHVAEEKSGDAKWENGKCKSKLSGQRLWWWESHGGEKYTWIPMDYLP
jgi:hypothetical protein